jgi:prepilin-type processing-associated H-X9-DG protein
MSTRESHGSSGMSLIGLLITMVLIVILAAIGLTAMKGAMGGGGATPVQQNQISTSVDREVLRRMFQSLAVYATSNDGRLPAPTAIAQSRDKSLDTSANFWASLIAQQYVDPRMLISENESSPNVVDYSGFSNLTYNPNSGQHWDPNFKADLSSESNVSFAHLALGGERFRSYWSMNAPGNYPLLGNRGPKDGVGNPESYACDTAGGWAGNFVYADGHVNFTQSPTPPGLGYASGSTAASGGDNIFQYETGYSGGDCIISFTSKIWEGGFELQWD